MLNDTIMNLVYPEKFAYQCIAFDFSWEVCNTQEKLETKGMHFFFVAGAGGGGAIKQGALWSRGK